MQELAGYKDANENIQFLSKFKLTGAADVILEVIRGILMLWAMAL